MSSCLTRSQAAKILFERKPEWLKIRPPAGESYTQIKGLLRERALHTVCEEAHCPNVAECWAAGTATFMIGGDTCTRSCRFCAVQTSRNPPPVDPEEPQKIAECVQALGLRYVVLTSVDRDDMPDGGAGHFAAVIRAIKERDPAVLVEALVPDFNGSDASIRTVVQSGVDVYGHNVETVRRLSPEVRDVRARYEQSLATLAAARRFAAEEGMRPSGAGRMYTKSGLMVGMTETIEDLGATFADLREYGVEVLTIGQYLRPSARNLPVARYWTPAEFDDLRVRAEKRGFVFVASGPLVRSSYKAAELFFLKQPRS